MSNRKDRTPSKNDVTVVHHTNIVTPKGTISLTLIDESIIVGLNDSDEGLIVLSHKAANRLATELVNLLSHTVPMPYPWGKQSSPPDQRPYSPPSSLNPPY